MNFGLSFGLFGLLNKIPPVGYVIEPPIDLDGTGNDEGGGVFNATLTWDNPTGNDNPTDKFYLYKDGYSIATIDNGVFTYVDKDVLPDHGYSYSIKLKDTSGYTSDRSLEVSVAIPNLTLAGAPTVDGLLVDYDTGRINITSDSIAGTYPIDHYIVSFGGKKTYLYVGNSISFPMLTPQGNAQTVQVSAVDTKGFVGTPANYSRSWWYSDFTLTESLTNTHFDSNLDGWSNGSSRTVTWDNGNAKFPTGSETANLFQDIVSKPIAKYFMLSRVQTNGLLKQHVDFNGETSSRIVWNTNGGWQEKFALRYGIPEWAQTWTDDSNTTALMDYFVVGEVTNQNFTPDSVQNLEVVVDDVSGNHTLSWTIPYSYSYPMTNLVVNQREVGGVFNVIQDNVTATSMVVAGAEVGKGYEYMVSASNVSGTSDSEIVLVGIPDGYSLGAPINLAGTGTDEGGGNFQARVTWEDNTGNTNSASSYSLFRDGVEVYTGAALEYIDTDVLPDSGYTYSISCVDILDYISGKSIEISVAIPNLILASTPSAPSKAIRGIDSFTLSWSAATSGTYAIAEYIIKKDDVEVSRTSDLTTPVYFTARSRTYPSWSVQAVDDHGFKSGDSVKVNSDSTDGDIQPIDTAIEWDLNGSNPKTTRVFIGALLQNETNINIDEFIQYKGLDNEFADKYTDVEFEFASEYIGNEMHTFPLAIKVTDADNFISARIWGGQIQVYERVNGTFSDKLKTAHSGNKYEKYKMGCVGNLVTLYRNGVNIFEYTSALADGYVGIVQREAPATNSYIGGRYKLTVQSTAVQITSNSSNGWHGFSAIKAGAANEIFGSMNDTSVSAGHITQLYVGGGTQCRLAFTEGNVGPQVTVVMDGVTGLFDYVSSSNDYELFDDPFSQMVRSNIGSLMQVSIA